MLWSSPETAGVGIIIKEYSIIYVVRMVKKLDFLPNDHVFQVQKEEFSVKKLTSRKYRR